MIKKILCVLVLCVLSVSAFCEETEEISYANRQISLRPHTSWDCSVSAVQWESDAPETASAAGSTITAKDVGFATLIATLSDGSEIHMDVEVSENAMPMEVRNAIDLALSEWKENLGSAFSQKNKYTAWYCGTGPKCYFGWCGGFVSYCLDTAGVPMDEPYDCVPQPHDQPYAVHAAGVGKILTGFTRMERISNIPKPGYLVIYGQRDRYNTIHIGMVTDVTDYGDGTFDIQTVEGNVSSRIKRYHYHYDSTNTNEHNMSMLPESMQTEGDIFQYKLHQDDWFVYTFCQTWLE